MYVQFNVFAKYTGGGCVPICIIFILQYAGFSEGGSYADKRPNVQEVVLMNKKNTNQRGGKKWSGLPVLPVNHSMIALQRATRSQILIGRQIVDEIYVNQFEAKFDFDQWSTR